MFFIFFFFLELFYFKVCKSSLKSTTMCAKVIHLLEVCAVFVVISPANNSTQVVRSRL